MAGAPLPTRKLKILNVRNAGENGKLAGNAESLGWMREDGERMVVHPASSVRRAEWSEGQLRILCEVEGEEPGSEVIALEGLPNEEFDNIWRYFEQNCGIHVKKHQRVVALDAEDFDRAMQAIEDAADRVDDAPSGSPQKNGRELDMLKRVEATRDGLEEAVSGDKQALNRVFSANGCERIGRLRLVLDTVQLEVYKKDPRWLHLRSACATIEAVLKDLGTFRPWRPPEDGKHESLLRRMMVRELKKAQGQVDEDDDDGEEAHPRAQDGAEAALEDGPKPLHAERLAQAFPVYGAAHPIYGAAPAEASAQQGGLGAGPLGRGPGQAAAEDAGSGEDGDDEEVTDPNSVRANAPDDRRREDRQQVVPGSLMEGWVWKRSRFLRRWRRRWLVLMPEHLSSFKTRSATKATETVQAGTALRVYSADAEVLQTRSFGIAVGRRTHYMVCDDDKQKEAWIREISAALLRK